jgi:uncharacterized protein (DUF2062 family)
MRAIQVEGSIFRRCIRQDSRVNQSHAIISAMLRDLIRRRLREPISTFRRQGITPQKIALSLALGLGLGVFAVLGVSTILCTGIALALRLNLPIRVLR